MKNTSRQEELEDEDHEVYSTAAQIAYAAIAAGMVKILIYLYNWYNGNKGN